MPAVCQADQDEEEMLLRQEGGAENGTQKFDDC